MSDIPQEWVEKVAAVLDDAANAGRGLGCVGPTAHQVAHVALAGVLPDIRRQVAQEIATAIEAERADVTRLDLKHPEGGAAFERARTLNEAAFIARYTGGAPLGKRYDEPDAVQEMFDTLARRRHRHGQAEETPMPT